MGLKNFGDTKIKEYEDCPFVGAEARVGLDLDAERCYISDFDGIDTSSLEYLKKGKRIDFSNKEKYVSGAVEEDSAAWNGYGYYFGSNGNIRVHNTNATGKAKGRNLIVIGDSYSKAVLPYIALSFENVYRYAPFSNRQLKMSLTDAIEKHNVSDVLIITSPNGIYSAYGSRYHSSIFM